MEPAATIIRVLKGEAITAKVAGVSLSTAYRWKYPCERGGTGGTIPSKYLPKLIEYARAREIEIPRECFIPHGLC